MLTATAVVAAATASACSYDFTSAREVAPRMYVAATRAGGLGGIAFADSLEQCVEGEGEADFLPLAGDRELAEDPFMRVECAGLVPLTFDELSRVFDGEGRADGVDVIPENDSPIEGSTGGYVRIPGEWFPFEYYLRYNQSSVRLVQWGFSNHWGAEIDHTYQVVIEGERRAIRTLRSRDRGVEFD